MSGIDSSSHRHTREALTTKVYGKDFDYESDEFLDLHDQWVSATSSWTFEEIRAALWEETLDSHFLGGSWPIAGWCRCGDHGDYIESFLRHYGIGATSEGEFRPLDEDNRESPGR
jgi:hypothetical protein